MANYTFAAANVTPTPASPGSGQTRVLTTIETDAAALGLDLGITSFAIGLETGGGGTWRVALQQVGTDGTISSSRVPEKLNTRSSPASASLTTAYTSSHGVVVAGNPALLITTHFNTTGVVNFRWHAPNPRYPFILASGEIAALAAPNSTGSGNVNVLSLGEPASDLRTARRISRRGRRRGSFLAACMAQPCRFSIVTSLASMNEMMTFEDAVWLQPQDWDLDFFGGSALVTLLPLSQAFTRTLSAIPAPTTLAPTISHGQPRGVATTPSVATLAARLTVLHGTGTTAPTPATILQPLRTVPVTTTTFVDGQASVVRVLAAEPAIVTIITPVTLVLTLRQIAEAVTTTVSAVTTVDRLLIALRAAATQVNPTTTFVVLRTVPTLLTTLVTALTTIAASLSAQRAASTTPTSSMTFTVQLVVQRALTALVNVITTNVVSVGYHSALAANTASTTLVSAVRTTFAILISISTPTTSVVATRVTFVTALTYVTTLTSAMVHQLLTRVSVTLPTPSTALAIRQTLLRIAQTLGLALTTATGILVTLRTAQTAGTATTVVSRRLDALRAATTAADPITVVAIQQTLLRTLTAFVAPATTAIRQLARSLFAASPSSAFVDRRLDARRSSTASPASAATSIATRIAPRDAQTSVTPQTPAPDLRTRVQRALVTITHPSTLVEMITSALTTATSPGYYVRGGQPRRRTIVTRPPSVRRAPVLPVQRRLAPVLIKTQLPAPALSVVRQLHVTALTFVQTVLQKARSTATNAVQPLPIVQQGDDPEALAALGIADSIAQSDQETDTDTFTALDL